ncbi:MAG: ThaI family type II restriction endonuclease [Candidatus Odinarchaeia archaeon]
MVSDIVDLFQDSKIVYKIKTKLPELFKLAELESSRAGKIGMEVGSLREKIIIALLIYKFGERNVETNIPITEPETDVKVFNKPLSIKTLTGKNVNGFKLIWTVDPAKAKEFKRNYTPSCDILLAHINWGGVGGFYHIPLFVQKDVFAALGRGKYIKLPKPGTNPRGVEISKEAVNKLIKDKNTNTIEINWQIKDIKFNPYKRWVEYWREE